MAGTAAIAALSSSAQLCKDGVCTFPGTLPRKAKLNLCLQWGTIPGGGITQKLDWLEAHDYQAVELPSGRWLLENGEALKKALSGRKLMLATACGPSRFDRADKAGNDKEVESFLPQLEVLGDLGSVGLIICPARGKPEVGLKELRQSFVEDYGKRLAEKAASCGTNIVLEPLQRRETPFLRQVADGAKMAQEIGKGCMVMADFWHMTWEEPNDRAAMIAAGDKLAHVHIASRKRRKIPGSDGAADDYREGFRGLKEIGYRGAVSLEARKKEKGKNAQGKPIYPDVAEREAILANMCKLLREQWAEV